MKNLTLLLTMAVILLSASCKKKEDMSEKVRLLTAHTWESDSLLVDGSDASETILANFNGDARFNTDHSGTFGSYSGTWQFQSEETMLSIKTDALASEIVARVVELTANSLKITTTFQNPFNPLMPFNIRMTFVPK